MPDNSSDNIPRPEHKTTASEWWGSFGTKVAVVVTGVLISLAAGWLNSISGKIENSGKVIAEQSQSLVVLGLKLDQINNNSEAAQKVAAEALGATRANDTRIGKIENTRFQEADAEKMLAPILERLNRLERKR